LKEAIGILGPPGSIQKGRRGGGEREKKITCYLFVNIKKRLVGESSFEATNILFFGKIDTVSWIP